FGLDDRGATLRFGRLDGRREKLLLSADRFELRELGLLLDHILGRGRLCERAGLVRLGLRLCGDLVRFCLRDLPVALSLNDEPFGGGPETLRLAGDLEHRLSGDEDADALLRDRRVLVREADLDLSCRELEPANLVDERPGERPGSDDNLHTLVVDGDEIALFVADFASPGTRNDQRLVRARDPIALGREEREKDEYGERRQNELRDGECHFKSLLSLRDRVAVYGGGRERTVTAIPWTPRI